MIDPIKLISSMQELMDKHGFRYSFAIIYTEGGSPIQVQADIQPMGTKFCRYPLEIWGDNDNNPA